MADKEVLFVPDELLISVRHATPTPWPYLDRLTALLGKTLQPFGLRVTPPTLSRPPRRDADDDDTGASVQEMRRAISDTDSGDDRAPYAGKEPSASGRGLQGGWTFRPATDELFHSVLRYGVAATDAQTQPVLVGAAVITARLRQLNAQLEEEVRISSAVPNWAMSGESSGYVVGGPGGRPAPESNPSGASRWHFVFSDAVDRVAPPGGEGVLVVVLDTSPDLQEVDSAAAAFGGHNSLLVEMATGGAHPVASWEDVLDEVDYAAAHGPNEEYLMRDHGLFVAGIIRDIAPACTLRVVRVLSDWGGGCLTSLIAGLEYVHDLAETHEGPIVVNLSLTVKAPVRAALGHLYKGLLHGHEGITNPYTTPEDASLPLLDVMRGLTARKGFPILFVAAAGNDSGTLRGNPLEPRVPAAYETTLGVAALNAAGQRASYSNRGDEADQVHNGIATFGGAPPAAGDEAGTGDAVRGLFSAPAFPSDAGSPPANTTGWAQWVGTSFATPVISGVSANLLAADPTLTAAQVMATLVGLAAPMADPTLQCNSLAASQIPI